MFSLPAQTGKQTKDIEMFATISTTQIPVTSNDDLREGLQFFQGRYRARNAGRGPDLCCNRESSCPAHGTVYLVRR